MAFDGLVLAAVRAELSKIIIQGKIDRVYQPEKEEIMLHIRQPGQNYKLILSAQAQDARVHLTTETKANPLTPPMFCMVLRKHLEGGRIIRIEQPNFERILHLYIESPNELGQLSEKILICEIMGKHSNIILVQAEDQTILDGIKRYTHAVSRYREVLPGRTYLAPPNQGKLNPLIIQEEELRDIIWSSAWDKTLPDILFQTLIGVSPLLARELVFRAGLPFDLQLHHCGEYELHCLWRAVRWLQETIATENYCPTIVVKSGKTAFSAVELTHLGSGDFTCYPTINHLLETYYAEKQCQRQWQERYQRLIKLVDNELSRCYKKRALQEESLVEVQDAENWRIAGELLTTYLWQLKLGDTEVELPNFYDPTEKPVRIVLDPQLTPAENAQQYFRKYAKKRDSLSIIQKQLAKTQEEIDYLESVQTAIEQAQSLAELIEIEQELQEEGYLKIKIAPGKNHPTKTKEMPMEPRVFVSSDGLEILVGRNNKQNDWLTLRLAQKEDWWFHTKNIPGSHVIVRVPAGKEIPSRTLEEAAVLAAYFSRAKNSSAVPVDYTQRKNIRKLKGTPPGRVLYDHQRTIYVTPTEELVSRLRKQ